MVGSYNYTLVFLSLIVAIIASYTALGMAERVYGADAKSARWWHVGGALAMGVGIWSMHFIGMLAFSLPIALGYDMTLTLLSLVIAIVVSYFALWQVTREYLSSYRLLVAAVLMGAGISAMHYMGMEAMQMFPAIQYEPILFALSIVIAVSASGAALYIIMWLRARAQQHFYTTHIAAATVMGVAIVGMHYTGMMSAQFAEGSICQAADAGLHLDTLAILVGLGSFAVLIVANLTSNFGAKNAYLLKSLEMANQQLKQQALYDTLTKLPNRVLLEERVNQSLQQAQQHESTFVLMAVDLDGFKTINDSIGANTGDIFLVEMANRIRTAVDSQFTVARTAGNEFVIGLDVDVTEAATLAQHLLDVIRRPVVINHIELVVTASIGIAVFPHDGLVYEDLAFNADAAMQFTKRSGKNGYKFYEGSMDANAARKLELLSKLRNAISRDQLSLNFQPKIDVKTNKVIGAEALLRWQHPKHGFISPAQFIPIAEESGLIVTIDNWVLNQACRQIHEWRLLGYTKLNISINISAVQFANDALYQTIVDALQKWEIPANSLTIEVTESTAMENVETSLEVLHKVADLGVKVAIDDFGTGYSSLLYLKRFPADELKIDRGFVRLLGQDNEDARIVAAIITLGHQFGMQIVAEGVETEEQVAILTNLDCDTLQGYFLGKPKPSEDFFKDHQSQMHHDGEQQQLSA